MDTTGALRLTVFCLAALGLGVWEARSPRRGHEPERASRWVGNLGVVVLSSLAVRLLFPTLPALLAGTVRAEGLGILSVVRLPYAAEFILSVLVLDAAVYFQHRAFHALTPLWRIHRMHHADTILDFTTGVRFHPLEIIISTAFKLTLAALLAPPPEAVIAFEILLNTTAMFNHANIRLPERFDGMLRRILVTPDMHRVHHSTDRGEMNTNFGFSFAWWDRLFATYRAQPAMGHTAMLLGLPAFRERTYRSLHWLLAVPFIEPAKPDNP